MKTPRKGDQKIIRVPINPIPETVRKRMHAQALKAYKERKGPFPRVDGIAADGSVRLLLGGGWVGSMGMAEYEATRHDIVGGKPYSKLRKRKRR